ncbi:metal ABC transporter permease [Roseicitreum antarcticum]|uniref:Manganese/zinc/iron transport system permease protein n=1 Tax=Roseicitreum antarcticum TaxID=564137 RepID=A0A1H3BUZ9_9RHOB|nr:metal ABC transporter permease [Roseicitreum antarcticum]SDX45842.1 manganese/zinc/iron transport system permease protein [Roseicitreum antarcticum]
MIDMLSSSLVQTVALGAAILGVISGTLGAFAVLRGQSLLGDTLSHAALPGVCLGFMVAGTRDLGAVLGGAFASGGVAALVVLLIARRTRLKTDAALGVVLSVFFAMGIVLLTLIQSRGGAAGLGLSGFLFGQAAAMLQSDLWIMGGLTALALILVLALWKEFKLITFDPVYARSLGLPVLALEVALTVMVALAIVVGLQMVGVILMVALLIAPAAAARQWTRSLGGMVMLSAAFGVISGVGGALISATARGLSTGPVVVLIATALAAVSMLAAPGRGLIWQAWARGVRRQRLDAGRVLLSVRGLSAVHDDVRYPTEQGMLKALHGHGTGRALSRLSARGLVRSVAHPPETTPHWELTNAGQRAADRMAETGDTGEDSAADARTEALADAPTDALADAPTDATTDAPTEGRR